MVAAVNIGKRTQLIWWWRWGCWQDWSLGWAFGLWPDPPVITKEGKAWVLFRYYHFGSFKIRRWLEDMK